MTRSIQDIQKDWLKREQQKLAGSLGGGRPKRQYLHFDRKIRKISQAITTSLWNPDAVMRHSFYPFLKVLKVERRRKKGAEENQKKFEKKERPLSYAAHFDALIFSWYAHVLQENYERVLANAQLQDEIIAYRKLEGRNNIHFAKQAFDLISQAVPCSAIALDITKFFDNLDHKILKEKWAEVLLNDPKAKLPDDHYRVYSAITKFAVAERDKVFEILGISRKKMGRIQRLCVPEDFRKKIRGAMPKVINVNENHFGIPQGSPISAVLANLYLLDFDKKMSESVKKLGGFYRRYSDDILIICKTEDVPSLEELAYREIESMKLNIKKEKAEIRQFWRTPTGVLCSDGNRPAKFQYLGLEFDGAKKSIRHKGIAKFERRMTRTIRNLKYFAMKKNKGIFPKRELYERFSHHGKQNYISYARRAEKIFGDSSQFKKQTVQNKIMKKIKDKLKTRKRKA